MRERERERNEGKSFTRDVNKDETERDIER